MSEDLTVRLSWGAATVWCAAALLYRGSGSLLAALAGLVLVVFMAVLMLRVPLTDRWPAVLSGKQLRLMFWLLQIATPGVFVGLSVSHLRSRGGEVLEPLGMPVGLAFSAVLALATAWYISAAIRHAQVPADWSGETEGAGAVTGAAEEAAAVCPACGTRYDPCEYIGGDVEARCVSCNAVLDIRDA